MIIFTLPLYRAIGQRLVKETPQLEFGKSSLKRFSNGEIYITVTSQVKGKHCIILGSIAPPDEQLLAVSLLAHTLKRQQAKEVIGLFPYLGYARQDKANADQSLTLAWAGQILKASGLDYIVTMDIHSPLAKILLPIPLKSYLATKLFVAKIPELRHPDDTTLIAPDQGAYDRALAIANKIGTNVAIVTFTKQRTARGLTHRAPQASIQTKKVVIIDDILDTGGTLLSCVRHLKKAGVNAITIATTHGLFTGNEWRKLFDTGVKRIYVTDSTPETLRNRSKHVYKLSSIPLMQTIISDLLREERR